MFFPEEVTALLRELSAIPYENLSKAIAFNQSRSLESALDFSATWMEDHRQHGLGGTCFALTYWLKVQMEKRGFSTAYLMADKRISQNIHCGLLFDFNNQLYLLDPGYLIYEPLLLPKAGLSTVAFVSPNAIRIEEANSVWQLHTGPQNQLKHRFDFRKDPVDLDEFQRHWEASYNWPMMKYPVLNRVTNGVQYYLQKNNFLTRTATSSEMQKLSPKELFLTVQQVFGLPESLVEEALGIMGYQSI